MPDYRRAWHPGGTYFFTVNLLQRHGNDLLTRHVDLLRDTVRSVRRRHPFTIHGGVARPSALHDRTATKRCRFCHSLAASGIVRRPWMGKCRERRMRWNGPLAALVLPCTSTVDKNGFFQNAPTDGAAFRGSGTAW